METASVGRAGSQGADPAHVQLLTQVLAREADLLDTNRYDEWLELLHPSLRYRVPIPEWVLGRSGTEEAPGEETADALAFTYLDETYDSLRLRVARLNTGLAHGEMPPSLTTRVVGVPLIERLEDEGEEAVYSVISHFALHQTRHENRMDVFAGRRKDEWCIGTGAVPATLRSRTVHLIQRVLPRAFSTFF